MEAPFRRMPKALPFFLAISLLAGCDMQRIVRVTKAADFFDEDEIAGNFQQMHDIFPSKTVARAPSPSALVQGAPLSLPETIAVDDAFMNTQYFLDYTGTTGLLVMKDDKIVFEQYYRGHNANQVHVSWSVAKSMISALIGIAIAEGHIQSVMDPVDRYAPELKGTGYEGVRLKDVLQMSSGIKFSEAYDDDNADVVKLAKIAALGGSFNGYAKQLKREVEPGTRNHYASYDTQVLAMVIQGATNTSLTDYMTRKLWQPLGTEHDAYWVTDDEGMEMAFGGFNASLRDYARFGQLYLHNGEWNGQTLVPEPWVKESLQMDGAHLQAGNRQRESFLGYGYQWWIPDNAEREYMAIGVYNQFIYISPKDHLVIVKNSANHHYVTDFDDFVTTYTHLALFRGIAEHLRNRSPHEIAP